MEENEMLAMLFIIALIFLAVVLLGRAMVNGGYDSISFTFLGFLGGFALAICIGIGAIIVS